MPIKNIKASAVSHLAKLLPTLRFFSLDEWNRMTDKEKIYMTYRHHLSLIGIGEAEVNVYETIIMQIIALSAYLTLLGYPQFVFMVPIVYIGLKGVKWLVGEWKDKRDFNTLDAEFSNRRNRAMRKLMGYSQVFDSKDSEELKHYKELDKKAQEEMIKMQSQVDGLITAKDRSQDEIDNYRAYKKWKGEK